MPDSASLAIEAEQGLLGCLLMAPDSFIAAAAIVRTDYFVEDVHRRVFEAMAECHRAGLRTSIGEVRQALGRATLGGELVPTVDLQTYLARLRVGGASSGSTSDYARAVRAHHTLRQLAAAIPDADAGGLPEAKVAAAFDRLDELRGEVADTAGRRASIGSIGQSVVERATAIAAGQADEPGVSTGFLDLDRAILGFRPGELIVAGGRPGMGKTTFATSSALKASDPHATQRRAGVLFFGLELGAEAIGARCLADLAFDRFASPMHSAIRSGRLDHHHVGMLREAEARLNELDLVVDHRSSVTVGEIEATCLAVQRRFEREGKRLGLVVIDYLKQVRASDRYRGNRVYEIGEITTGLRDVAKRLQVCVVLLVQLNRGVESRDDKRPTLADLRESGDLENDADVVLLLYRPAYYLKRQVQAAEPDEAVALQHRLDMVEHDLEVIVAKNRNGEGEHSVKLWTDIGRSAVRSRAWEAA